MYLLLMLFLSCVTGRLLWKHLLPANRNLFLRLILTLLLSAAVFIILLRISICFSVYLFQINDPVTW